MHPLERHAPVGVAERYELNFETADAAVNAALDFHHALRLTTGRARPPACGWASTSGQVVRFGGSTTSRMFQVGQAMSVCRQSGRLARGGPDAPDPHSVRHRARARPAGPVRAARRRSPSCAGSRTAGTAGGRRRAARSLRGRVEGQAPLTAPPGVGSGPAGRLAGAAADAGLAAGPGPGGTPPARLVHRPEAR